MVHRDLSVDDVVNVFSCLEMDTENPTGTVDAYDRHIFLYYKNNVSWPPRVEADPLVNLVAATWQARKNDMTFVTKITVCETREGAGFSDGDALIFPEMIKYRCHRKPTVVEKRLTMSSLPKQIRPSLTSYLASLHCLLGQLLDLQRKTLRNRTYYHWFPQFPLSECDSSFPRLFLDE